jgi:hypothetical protein
MANNDARKMSSYPACTAPEPTAVLVLTGNTTGTPNTPTTFKVSITTLFGNSQANVYVKNGYSFSANVVTFRYETTPANSIVGGLPSKTMWFDNNAIYCVLANGYIKKAALSAF